MLAGRSVGIFCLLWKITDSLLPPLVVCLVLYAWWGNNKTGEVSMKAGGWQALNYNNRFAFTQNLLEYRYSILSEPLMRLSCFHSEVLLLLTGYRCGRLVNLISADPVAKWGRQTLCIPQWFLRLPLFNSLPLFWLCTCFACSHISLCSL